MKPALAILAIVAVASGYKIPSTGPGVLARELQDFVDLIPLNEAKELVNAYLSQGREFNLPLSFVGSKESKAFIIDFEATPEYKKLLEYIQNAGVDVYYLMQKVNEALDIRPVNPLKASDRKISGGLLDFAEDFSKDDDFQGLFDYVTECLSPDYAAITSNPHFLNLLTQVEQDGVNSTAFNNQYFILLAIKVVLAQ